MQPSYYITKTGVNHVIASSTPAADDISRLLLLHFLKQINYGPVSFSDILKYFNNDKSLTFKKISSMISYQLIDMSESNLHSTENTISQSSSTISHYCSDNDYVLADLNGLAISSCGFNQIQASNISAIAYDYIKASKRSRYEIESHEIESPLSIRTSWNNLDIIIYVLYINKFSCLLITKNEDFINKNEFIHLASHLCNRYNYE